jgi:hypothetical protein
MKEKTMRLKILTVVLALAGGVLLTVNTSPAQAADTTVTCNGPVVEMNTGQDGTPPRFTIHCTTGSSAGNITFFAYKIATSGVIAEMLLATFNGLVGSPSILLSSNLSDTSGAAWGCAASNCRIIDYLFAY